VSEVESDVKYAMKTITKTKALHYHLAKQVERELSLHQNLSHRNILSMLAWFHDKKCIFIILEMASASLADLISHRYPIGMDEKMIRSISWSILNGLVYLKSLNVIHRDIKPRNLLLVEKGDKYVVKIGDFGSAVHTTPEDLRKTVRGTCPYMAPEIVEGKGYSFGVDVWSFGVSLHELLTGCLPFDGESPMEIYRKIVREEYVCPAGLSGGMHALLHACMQKDAEKRMSAVDIRRDFFDN